MAKTPHSQCRSPARVHPLVRELIPQATHNQGLAQPDRQTLQKINGKWKERRRERRKDREAGRKEGEAIRSYVAPGCREAPPAPFGQSWGRREAMRAAHRPGHERPQPLVGPGGLADDRQGGCKRETPAV